MFVFIIPVCKEDNDYTETNLTPEPTNLLVNSNI